MDGFTWALYDHPIIYKQIFIHFWKRNTPLVGALQWFWIIQHLYENTWADAKCNSSGMWDLSSINNLLNFDVYIFYMLISHIFPYWTVNWKLRNPFLRIMINLSVDWVSHLMHMYYHQLLVHDMIFIRLPIKWIV